MTTLSYDDYLKAKGLFHLAQEHYFKSQEFEKALLELLGGDNLPDINLDFVLDAINMKSTLECGLSRAGISPPDVSSVTNP